METIENIKSNHLHLGKKIERVRRLRGMTQTELGQLLGITKLFQKWNKPRKLTMND